MKPANKTSFSQYYDTRSLKKEISNTSNALILTGTALAVLSLFRSFLCTGFAETLYIALAVCGLGLIALGTFLPQQMLPVSKKLFAFCNRIGVFVLRGLLVFVYLFMFLTTFWYAKRKKCEYRFIRWEDAPPAAGASWFEKENTALLNDKKFFRVTGSIFAGISAHKLYILIPLIILLLLIGLIFFFISSSTIFSFIYTFI